MDQYYHPISVDAKIMVSNECPNHRWTSYDHLLDITCYHSNSITCQNTLNFSFQSHLKFCLNFVLQRKLYLFDKIIIWRIKIIIIAVIPLGGSLLLGSLGSKGMRRSRGSPNWSCGGPLKSGPWGPRNEQDSLAQNTDCCNSTEIKCYLIFWNSCLLT